jgi:hypothetical protein
MSLTFSFTDEQISSDPLGTLFDIHTRLKQRQFHVWQGLIGRHVKFGADMAGTIECVDNTSVTLKCESGESCVLPMNSKRTAVLVRLGNTKRPDAAAPP